MARLVRLAYMCTRRRDIADADLRAVLDEQEDPDFDVGLVYGVIKPFHMGVNKATIHFWGTSIGDSVVGRDILRSHHHYHELLRLLDTHSFVRNSFVCFGRNIRV